MKDEMPWGPSPALGHYTYWVRDDRWEFSDGLYAILGLGPSDGITTELLLRHQHPDDIERTRALIAGGFNESAGYSYQHRVVDTAGFVHEVIAVGSNVGSEDDEGGPRSEGFVVDISEVGGHPAVSTPMMPVEFDPDDLVITPCPHCPHWWAEVVPSAGSTVLREWHAPFCPEVLHWTTPDPATLTRGPR
ncbi:hypothetical protein KV097_11055 [Mumia sp. zg.B17]|uniref:hypothetical protein n=1 Tax=Mumia sp. zg.B17 TaxID=2855446 RepID=UPI001C6DD9AF|nr:hypothetical protein [Mumia sp. zg.B17]MBW9206481.1 hypothetical protein [Mumia sp. zg.B17]